MIFLQNKLIRANKGIRIIVVLSLFCPKLLGLTDLQFPIPSCKQLMVIVKKVIRKSDKLTCSLHQSGEEACSLQEMPKSINILLATSKLIHNIFLRSVYSKRSCLKFINSFEPVEDIVIKLQHA